MLKASESGGRARKSFAERNAEFRELLVAARHTSDPDSSLASMLASPEIESLYRIIVAAALGEFHGPTGSRALRNEVGAAKERMARAQNSRKMRIERDLICACVVALCKREGSKASDIYVEALKDKNPMVSEYGVAALASAGDDSGWDTVVAMLERKLRRPIGAGGLQASWVGSAIMYLAGHSAGSSRRTGRLTEILRKNWNRIPDKGQATKLLPGVAPHGASD